MGCKLIDSMSFVKSQVSNLDTMIELSYVCMIARVPMLMIGNPGTGKSHTSKLIASMFGDRDDAWFYQSITAQTSPEKLFGGLIAEKMLQGVEEYNLAVGAANKVGNIFDELYKSQHPAMMNALLNYFDEQPTIFSGGKNISPKWHWCFNTTNFEDLPEDLRFCPLWDRQGAKYKVQNLSKDESKKALLHSMTLKCKATNPPSLTVADLELARKSAMGIDCPETVIDAFYEKLEPILQKYAYLSQRKIHSLFIGKPGCPSILQAAAYISGTSEIMVDHLALVPYFCWQDINDYEKLITEVSKAILNPVVGVYKEITKNVDDLVAEIRAKKHDYNSALRMQKILTDSITARLSPFSENDKKQAQEIRKRLGTKVKVLNTVIDALAPKLELGTMEF